MKTKKKSSWSAPATPEFINKVLAIALLSSVIINVISNWRHRQFAFDMCDQVSFGMQQASRRGFQIADTDEGITLYRHGVKMYAQYPNASYR